MSSKVKDGLFLGDIDAAQDAEFLQLNGIVHIINCVPRQVPNLFQQSLGLSYVTCDLDEVLRRPFFDVKNREFMGIVQLIDRALERTESVLVHSLNGLNRSPSVMMAYLMVKYCWGVDKAYEFLLSKRADIKPHESFIDQLCSLEAQLQAQYTSRATEQQMYEWQPTLGDPHTDEIVLIHTFLNSTSRYPVGKKNDGESANTAKKKASRRLTWIDQSNQLKKMFPSLMIKPERPPNNSYSEMLVADGWLDLINPANSSGAASASMPKPIAAFVEEGPNAPNDAADPSDADSSAFTTRNHRVHSFSMPKRRGVEVENQGSLSPPSVSSDREEHDLSIDVGPVKTVHFVQKQQPQERYQSQLRGSVSGRPRRPASRQTMGRAHSTADSSTASYASAINPSLAAPVARPSMPEGVRATVSEFAKTSMSRTTKPTKTATKNQSKSATTVPASRAPPEKRNSINSGSSSARGLFPSDLQLPQGGGGGTAATFSVRRGRLQEADFLAGGHGLTGASTGSRPRTAPPRLRKYTDARDMLPPSKKIIEIGSSAKLVHRVTLEAPATLGSSTINRRNSAASVADYGTTSTATSMAFSAGGAANTAPFSRTPLTRPKTVRAHWK